MRTLWIIAAIATILILAAIFGNKSGQETTADAGAADTTASDTVNTLADLRDGKRYKIAKMPDGKTWMTENLNYATGGSCYDNKASNCAKYGRLYSWQTAAKACPAGFHLPSNQDWEDLVTAIGGRETAGKRLKSTSGWNAYEGKDGNGTDDFGFSALPGGYCQSGGSCEETGNAGKWWTATTYNAAEGFSEIADYRGMYYIDGSVYENTSLMDGEFSVRCVRNGTR